MVQSRVHLRVSLYNLHKDADECEFQVAPKGVLEASFEFHLGLYLLVHSLINKSAQILHQIVYLMVK